MYILIKTKRQEYQIWEFLEDMNLAEFVSVCVKGLPAEPTYNGHTINPYDLAEDPNLKPGMVTPVSNISKYIVNMSDTQEKLIAAALIEML
jgi:hypothetical protein